MSRRKRTSRVALPALATILFTAAVGCAEPALDTSVPAVSLHVAPGGIYHIDGDPNPVPVDDLPGRLAARLPDSQAPLIRVLAEPGVVGYDVALAFQAARRAGYRHAEGVADYTPGATNDKRWEQELKPWDGGSAMKAEAELPVR